MKCLIKQPIENRNRCAIQINNHCISYFELDILINECLKDIYSNKMNRQIIPFQAKENIETIIRLLALFRIGLVPFPINRRLKNSQVQLLVAKSNVEIDLAQKPFLCLATSGSSGQPKIAILSFQNMYFSALGSIRILELSREHKYLLSLPLHHIGGIIILFRVFLCGATLVLPEKNLISQIASKKITHLSLVPTQLQRLLEKSSLISFSTLKYILLGGAPISPYLYEQISKYQIPVLFSYGMTEMSSTIAIGSTKDNLQILPYREVAISPFGEILVKGECLFLGYLGEKKINVRQWFHTKDIGFLSKEGYLSLLGRKDRMFICGGENIYPEMIEKVIYEVLNVDSTIVVGVPDYEYGTLPFAFIETHLIWNESEYKTLLHAHLPSLFLPIRILSLPKKFSHSLKIDYALLQKIACNSLGITMGSV